MKQKLGNKGFTLIEILGVLVILSLILVIVGTKGFGAFDNAKSKITELQRKSIKESANLMMQDILYCDEEISADLITNLLPPSETEKTCQKLKELAATVIEITPNMLIENGYLDEEDVKELTVEQKQTTLYTATINDDKITIQEIE